MIMIVSTILVLAVVGLLVGLMLVFAEDTFHVEVDPRAVAIKECLPGANCGACGYAGCEAMADAIAKGEAPVNGCTVGGFVAAEKISAVMGVTAEAAEKRSAFVKCAGTCGVTKSRGNYVGVETCEAVVSLLGKGEKACQFGCLGFGSCVKVCEFDAISIKDGIAVVDSSKCVACGKCVGACPQHIIAIIPERGTYNVKCSSNETGAVARKQCSVGCIGCGLCARVCEHEAVSVVNNLAKIDWEKCVGCGKCAEKCPVKIIKLR